jgi:hypothetical protein
MHTHHHLHTSFLRMYSYLAFVMMVQLSPSCCGPRRLDAALAVFINKNFFDVRTTM